jgi:hypothetical protein
MKYWCENNKGPRCILVPSHLQSSLLASYLEILYSRSSQRTQGFVVVFICPPFHNVVNLETIVLVILLPEVSGARTSYLRWDNHFLQYSCL